MPRPAARPGGRAARRSGPRRGFGLERIAGGGALRRRGGFGAVWSGASPATCTAPARSGGWRTSSAWYVANRLPRSRSTCRRWASPWCAGSWRRYARCWRSATIPTARCRASASTPGRWTRSRPRGAASRRIPGARCTPLAPTAMRQTRPEIAQALIHAGARLDAPCPLGDLPIHLAATHGWLAVLDMLLTTAADIEARTTAVSESMWRLSSPAHSEPTFGPDALGHRRPRRTHRRRAPPPCATAPPLDAIDSRGWTPLHTAAAPWWQENAELAEPADRRRRRRPRTQPRRPHALGSRQSGSSHANRSGVRRHDRLLSF